MNRVIAVIRQFDHQLVSYFRPNAIYLLRCSVGTIYLLFGALKFFPHFSPAEKLATDTIEILTFGFIEGEIALVLLAVIECVIGAGLLFNVKIRWIVRLALWHMLCTFFPMIFLPGQTYTDDPSSLSLVGQYILKNVVVVSALLTVYTHKE